MAGMRKIQWVEALEDVYSAIEAMEQDSRETLNKRLLRCHNSKKADVHPA